MYGNAVNPVTKEVLVPRMESPMQSQRNGEDGTEGADNCSTSDDDRNGNDFRNIGHINHSEVPLFSGIESATLDEEEVKQSNIQNLRTLRIQALDRRAATLPNGTIPVSQYSDNYSNIAIKRDIRKAIQIDAPNFGQDGTCNDKFARIVDWSATPINVGVDSPQIDMERIRLYNARTIRAWRIHTLETKKATVAAASTATDPNPADRPDHIRNAEVSTHGELSAPQMEESPIEESPSFRADGSEGAAGAGGDSNGDINTGIDIGSGEGAPSPAGTRSLE